VCGKIGGHVTNSQTGNPIQGANVSASGPGSGSDGTDANGDYEISALTPGTYTVTASATNYKTQTKEGNQVTASQTTLVHFALGPAGEWDPYPGDGGISCSGITSPTNGYGYACNSDITCTIADAHDHDHRYAPAGSPPDTYPEDTFNGENAYVWSADAGSFPNSNRGKSVTWRAPNTPTASCTITCRVDDDAQIPEGDTGDRDDAYRDYSVTVVVYKVRCLTIDATYDVDIYWPNAPNYSDRVWAANTDVYASSGTVDEIWHRERIADIFRPSPQSYRLACAFYRYPACQTDQTLITNAHLLDSDAQLTGWQPYITILDRSNIGRRSYKIVFTFTVGGRQVEGEQITQTVPGDPNIYFMDYAIYDSPTCPAAEFTDADPKDHLYFASECGEGQSQEADIAHKVLHEVNGGITTGCICSQSFEDIWQGAKGPARGGHSDGQCCCRAKGMIEVLQVLGFSYVQDFVNELSEPNSGRNKPGNQYCGEGWPWHWGYYQRWAQGGGNWNNWQGVCKNQNGATCYSPQGRHESDYETMNDAPDYPNSGPDGTLYAFIYYAWISDPVPTPEYCTHLPTPP
jgi:hypothetical protein